MFALLYCQKLLGVTDECKTDYEEPQKQKARPQASPHKTSSLIGQKKEKKESFCQFHSAVKREVSEAHQRALKVCIEG